MKLELPKGVKLRTCPFCGAEAVLKTDRGQVSKTRYWVKCANDACAVSPTAQESQEAAIDNWNSRGGK